MGLLSNIFGSNNNIDENIPPIMPSGAVDQIKRGILPTINTNQLMLTNGETCHFAERAIRITEKKFKTLTTCVPYSNALKLQFGNTTITLMVPDGNVANIMISMIGQKVK